MSYQHTIEPYRYAKDSVVVKFETHPLYKTPAHYIAEKYGRWVHRARGYVMSEQKAIKFSIEVWKACPHPEKTLVAYRNDRNEICVKCGDCGAQLKGMP